MKLNIAFDILPGLIAGAGKHQARTFDYLEEKIGSQINKISAFSFGTRFQRPSGLPCSVDFIKSMIPGRIQRLLVSSGLPIELLYNLKTDLVYTFCMRWFKTRVPFIVNIFDLSWRHFSGQYRMTFTENQIYAAEEAIAKSTAITTGSKTTADELIKSGVNPKRVHVIYLGVDQQFFDVKYTEQHAVKARYDLPENYILYLGGINERKNTGVLLKAVQSINGKIPLVIAGPPPAEPLEHWGIKKSTSHHLGYIPDSDVPGLVAAATMVVFPSKCEGFGLPLLEAMAAGTPVIASDIPVFKEIGKQAPVFFNPDNPDELYKKIQCMRMSKALREECKNVGKAIASRFTWNSYASILMDAFESIILYK